MRSPSTKRPRRSFFWDLLTFERMVTGPILHLVYWAGLGMIAIVGFGVVGAGVGLGVRDEGWAGWLLAFGVLVAGLLFVAALALIWRGTCEFYVAVFRISDDLRALRRNDDARLEKKL